VDPCEIAIARYKDIARWRNLWTILLFVFGASVVAFLSVAILLFIRAGWLAGAISMVGTIVNGVAVKWVVERRAEAVAEDEAAYLDVQARCAQMKGTEGNEIERWRGRQRLFGLIR
jgi:hypothetical protein